MESTRRNRSRSRSPSRKHKESHKHSRHHRHRDDEEDSPKKHKHRREKEETEEERKERKRAKKEKRKSERDARGHESDGLEVMDDDDDAGVWVEKSIDGDEATSTIPTSLSLPLRSNPNNPKSTSPLPPTVPTTTQTRDDWMLDPSTQTDSSSYTAKTLGIVPTAREGVPHSASLPSSSKDMTDGYGEESSGNRTLGGGVDFFDTLGTERKRKDPNEGKPDPSKLAIDKRELNQQLVQGKSLDEYETVERKIVPGGPGAQWRMMKLRRLYEQAEEQGRNIEEIAMERYGSLDEFNEALNERRILDERQQRKDQRRGNSAGYNSSAGGGGGYSSQNSSGMRTPEPGSSGRRFMFTSEDGPGSRPPSRGGFRRPGEKDTDTPAAATGGAARVDELRRRESGLGATPGSPGGRAAYVPGGFGGSKPSTPIPSVFTPQGLNRTPSGFPFTTPLPNVDSNPEQPTTTQTPSGGTSKPPLSLEALNRLQAKVLRAKLMDDPEAERLEDEYENERLRAVEFSASGEAGLWQGSSSGIQGNIGREEVGEGGNITEVQVLPTLDGRGKLYDVGTRAPGDVEIGDGAGNRRKKLDLKKFETRDNKGQLLRYNADDDDITLGEMVRQEKFGAGSADQKNLDAELASRIAGDGKFEDDLEYMDDNAERLARKKMKTDAMKRAFAVNDYARTKKALDTCPFCYQDDRPPQTAIVALGKRTYLCCTQTEELVKGHCLIVPLQHCLSSLEMEDDDWDEVKNFMKCLMRMYAAENKGAIFFETCISFKQQRHTYIECVPVPAGKFEDLPAYFKESILSSESEWTQHKKLIDFSQRPGGFRRAMVPNLPYFMVQWDYRGEKGYGHVIEGVGDAPGRGVGEEDMGGAVGEGDKSGEEFPRYFAAEIIGNVLGLEPRKWRRPKRMDVSMNSERARALGTTFQPYNWTVQLQE